MFCTEYGHKLSEALKLSVGDIFEASVKYNRHSEVLIGMKKVYESFKLKGGEILVFEFFFLKCVRLSIIDTNEMEVFYPKLIFPNESALCRLGMKCVGFHFSSHDYYDRVLTLYFDFFNLQIVLVNGV